MIETSYNPEIISRSGRGGLIETGYRPRVWQAAVHKVLKRFSVLVIHRRAGKTVLAINTLVDAALQHDSVSKPMGHYAYVAPYAKQARNIAWGYLRLFTESIPGVKYNEQSLTATLPNGVRIVLYGADNPDSLRGLYFDGVVIDEVADMRPQVWGEIIRPALQDRLGWAIFIGTPKGINLFSEVYHKALERPDWAALVLNCYQTDSISPDEIEKARREMTEAQFSQEMLCDFHAAVENALISVGDVQAAMKRRYKKAEWSFAPKVMGVDIACYGNDRSVIARRQGLVSHGHTVMRGETKPMVLASRIAQAADRFKPQVIFIDIGYAPGVANRVEDLGYPVIGVGFGEKSIEERFENKRAEMWWNLGEWVKNAALPEDSELINDLCAITYNLKNRRGKIQLESKDELRKRGLPSPDLGDAYALTFAETVEIGIDEVAHGATPTANTKADYDYAPY